MRIEWEICVVWCDIEGVLETIDSQGLDLLSKLGN